MPDHQMKALKNDPIQHLDDEFRTALARHENLSGCFTVIGPVQVCYSAEGSGFKVCLKLAGVEITCAKLDPSNPCAKLEGNVVCAKASIEVCIDGTCLKYKAQACYKDLPCIWGDWKCTDASGTIICF